MARAECQTRPASVEHADRGVITGHSHRPFLAQRDLGGRLDAGAPRRRKARAPRLRLCGRRRRSSSSGKPRRRPPGNQPGERSSSTLAEMSRRCDPGDTTSDRPCISMAKAGWEYCWRRHADVIYCLAPCYLRDDESTGCQTALAMRVANLSGLPLRFSTSLLDRLDPCVKKARTENWPGNSTSSIRQRSPPSIVDRKTSLLNLIPVGHIDFLNPLAWVHAPQTPYRAGL
jgi:hypothetical protein